SRRRRAAAPAAVPPRGRRAAPRARAARGRGHPRGHRAQAHGGARAVSAGRSTARRARGVMARPPQRRPRRRARSPAAAVTPLVVLLHGLGRGHGSMAKLGAHLAAHGFDTWSRTYPSRRAPIAEIARALADTIAHDAAGRPVCAVTHSMGGVVARHLHDPRIAWQRIVMLAPPNQGSQLARAAADHPVYRWFFGP